MPFQYKVSEDKKVRVIIDTDLPCEADAPICNCPRVDVPEV